MNSSFDSRKPQYVLGTDLAHGSYGQQLRMPGEQTVMTPTSHSKQQRLSMGTSSVNSSIDFKQSRGAQSSLPATPQQQQQHQTQDPD